MRKHKGHRGKGRKAPMVAPGGGDGAPIPGPNEFSAEDEAAMRGGQRSARGAPPTDGSMPTMSNEAGEGPELG